MYKVVLIRHGKAFGNKENRFTDGPMWTFPKKAGKKRKKPG
jgi:bisphosphoglycerate-dependent phosphoglycerate mutase